MTLPDAADARGGRTALVVALAVAALLTVLCALAWRLALAWPLTRDLPILLYLAMAWDHWGVLPHAGSFDMNFIGSYVAYRGIGRVFGWDAASVRHADLAVYLALGAATIAAMRRAGPLAGWIAAALFGLVYLQAGPDMTLQRELLMLLPLAAAVAAATRLADARAGAAALAAGVGIGVAMTIKPQAAVAAVPVAAFLVDVRRRAGADAPRAALEACGALALGAAAVLAAAIAALWALGVLGAFVDIATHYLPLYGDMNGRHETFEAGERLRYSLEQTSRLGGHGLLVVAAAVGVGAHAAQLPAGDPGRREAALFGGLAATFAAYPMLSGKFWDYHWLPMTYWLSVCAALAVAPVGAPRRRAAGWIAAAVLVAAIVRTFPPGDDFGGVLAQRETRNATAEELGDFLAARLLPGETVQPMDWTKGGVVHAMLRAEAPPATSFVYDFHFYHHVSTPYVKALRRRFLAELERSAPRYIVKSRFGPFPSGRDADRRFPGFARILARDYAKVAETLAYTIYERRPEPRDARERRSDAETEPETP